MLNLYHEMNLIWHWWQLYIYIYIYIYVIISRKIYFHQEHLFSTLWYPDKSFIDHIVAAIARAGFRIVAHSYTAVFLRKIILCETNNILCYRETSLMIQLNNRQRKTAVNLPIDFFESYYQREYPVKLSSFLANWP